MAGATKTISPAPCPPAFRFAHLQRSSATEAGVLKMADLAELVVTHLAILPATTLEIPTRPVPVQQ